MLGTPGRSPRLLPPRPSPSPSQKQRHGKDLMGPPPCQASKSKKKRLRDVEVLDEDSYVEAIEHIVQRDYFPDLPRLQDRLQWLEAIRTGDPEAIRAAQLRIVSRRAQRSQASATPGSSRGTPSSLRRTPASTFGTPGGCSLVGSTRTPGGTSLAAGIASEDDEEEAAAKRERLSMSLDEFLLSHTSQDNASFKAINEKENRKKKEKASQLYLLEGPGGVVSEPASGNSSSTALVVGGAGTMAAAGECTGSKADPDRKTDGFGSTGQPVSTLDFWPYKAKNELMYDSANRGDAPLTQAEITERAIGPPKQVKYQNTRFRTSDAQQQQDLRPSVEDKVAILYNPIPGETPVRYMDPHGERGSRKGYDLEDLRRTPRSAFEAALDEAGDQAANVESVGLDGKPTSYEYVSTPQLNPGEGPDASPFMTWGDIESTPLRLEAEDTPVGIGGSADGPHFSIPKAAARDEAAINMSRAAAKSLKQRERLKAGVDSPGLGFGTSPGTRRRGSLTPGMSPVGLSPAARKLVSKAAKIKGSSGFDATLRASYANSPLRTPERSSSARKTRASGLAGPSPSPLPRVAE